MKANFKAFLKSEKARQAAIAGLTFVAVSMATNAHASGYAAEPWSAALQDIQTVITGPVAKAGSIIALGLGGLSSAYSDGGHHKTVGRLIMGVGLAVGAANIFSWLFGMF